MKKKEHTYLITKIYNNYDIEELERTETEEELQERIKFYKNNKDIMEIRVKEKIIIEKYIDIL